MNNTVLVVDDDDSVRCLICMVLQRSGWKTIAAATGNDAVGRCYEHDGPITLLIADVHLPDMTGNDMAQILTAMRSDMKVLFLSGDLRESVVDADAAFLQKPFVAADLQLRIEEVLDRRRAVPV